VFQYQTKMMSFARGAENTQIPSLAKSVKRISALHAVALVGDFNMNYLKLGTPAKRRTLPLTQTVFNCLSKSMTCEINCTKAMSSFKLRIFILNSPRFLGSALLTPALSSYRQPLSFHDQGFFTTASTLKNRASRLLHFSHTETIKNGTYA